MAQLRSSRAVTAYEEELWLEARIAIAKGMRTEYPESGGPGTAGISPLTWEPISSTEHIVGNLKMEVWFEARQVLNPAFLPHEQPPLYLYESGLHDAIDELAGRSHMETGQMTQYAFYELKFAMRSSKTIDKDMDQKNKDQEDKDQQDKDQKDTDQPAQDNKQPTYIVRMDINYGQGLM